MSIGVGVLLAIVGSLAILAGATGLRRLRRLRRQGVSVWAMAVPLPAPAGELADRSRILLQYTLEDGRVVERIAASTAHRGGALEPGRRVLIWYDPADPEDMLVFGRDRGRSDWAFMTAGMLLIVVGVTVAVLGG
jgi:hypothetical protein